MSRWTTLVSVMTAASMMMLAACRQSGAPHRMLWAWERPEDLRFLDPAAAGVAYLAGTIEFNNGDTRVKPRLQPLLLPEGVYLVGVVRLEAGGETVPAQRQRAVDAILELTDRPSVRAVQIDFDAKVSQRTFYRELLVELRRRLSPGRGLSMTALASWCIHDNWLGGLPVDEAVPMVFQMGADDRQVRMYLDSGRDFIAQVCRQSTGVAAGEPWPRIPYGRRIWIFSPRPWTRATAETTLFALRKD